MNETITVGGVKFTAANVTTGLNSISFMLPDLTEDEAKAAFKNAKSLSVGEGKTAYGEYPDVEFLSITIGANESVTVTMHILSETERQIRELQTSQAEFQVSQAEQDEVIAEMLYGGGEA